MNGIKGLVKEIISKPDDDEPRLIYADWLEENGEAPRAEFIRMQCGLSAMENWEHGYDSLKQKSLNLLRKHEADWKRELGISSRLYFRRGFIERILVTPKALLAMDPGIFSETPIMSVQLTRVNPKNLLQVRESGVMKSVLGVNASSNLSNDQIVEVLKMVSRKVSKLDLSGLNTPLDCDLAKAIGEASFSKHLTEFCFRASPATPGFFEVLADTGGLPNVRRLEFGGGFYIVRPAYFENMKFGKVRHLKVGGKLRVVDCQELCFLPMKKLASVSLRGTRPPAAGLKLLIEAGMFKSAERINLGTCNLSKTTLDLVLSTKAPKCTHLNLAHNASVDNEAIGRVLDTKMFPKLKAVNVMDTKVDLPGKFINDSPVSITF